MPEMVKIQLLTGFLERMIFYFLCNFSPMKGRILSPIAIEIIQQSQNKLSAQKKGQILKTHKCAIMDNSFRVLLGPVIYVKISTINNQIETAILKFINQADEMLNPFFCFDTLQKGSKLMTNLIKQCGTQVYQDNQELVLPNVKPGFLRHSLPAEAPEVAHPIEHLIETTRQFIFPGVMKWQSPKFFGYYPSSVNVASVLGDMFAAISHSPAFVYGVSPSHTELENIVVDWTAIAIGLPQKFLLKNSGGGTINNTASEGIFGTVHAAKFLKRKHLNLQSDSPETLKFVGYYGEGSHSGTERSLYLKDIHHRRSVPYIYNPEKLNYELDVDRFEEMISGDVQSGLIPFWFGFSYGNTFSAAIDISMRAIQICKRHQMWIHVDAAYLGSAWLNQKYRPPREILDEVNSIDLNYSKLMLNGTGSSFLFVDDKDILTESFSASVNKFPFYKNEFTGQRDVVDYKDWTIGLGRRNYAIKLYYFYTHYGLRTLRNALQELENNFNYLLDLINGQPQLFKMHTVQYGVCSFHVLGKDGSASNEISKKVTAKICNIKEGFSTPGSFKGNNVVRISIGNFHTTKQHIKKYFDTIVAAAKQARDEI